MKTNKPENFDDESERIKQENQNKRMRLNLEYGADFPIESINQDLPPEVESQFLDNVLNFEKAFHNSERIKIYDFIGKPEYKKSETIPDSEISSELDQMMQLLNQYQIHLDTLCEVDNHTLYRFITEELFFTKIDNIKMDGWISYFTYEEFHPNHEYDLRNSCHEFVELFLDKESDFYTRNLAQEAEENKWFENFRQSFKSFTLNNIEIKSIQFDESNAKVQFDISFSGIIEDSNQTENFSGIGELNFLYQWGYWYIQEVSLPTGQK